MTTGSNTFFSNQTTTVFIVKNVSTDQKTISLFNCPVPFGASRDLLAIPEVSESDIRHSLLKGDLSVKIRSGDITIVDSHIDLMQFDNEQRQFLINAGVTNGIRANGTTVSWMPGDEYADAQTWGDVMDLVGISNTPLTINVDGDRTIPPGTYDMRQSKIANIRFGDATARHVDLEDGAVLYNLGGISGAITLAGHSTNGPSLTFNYDIPQFPPVLFALDSARISNYGTSPMIDVPDNAYFVLASTSAGGFEVHGTGSLVNLGHSCVFLSAAQSATIMSDNLVSGPADALFVYENFGYLPSPLPVNLNYAGPYANAAFSYIGGSGPTSFRPIPFLPGGVPVGCSYFDTDLTPPRLINWSGTQWVDGVGTAV